MTFSFIANLKSSFLKGEHLHLPCVHQEDFRRPLSFIVVILIFLLLWGPLSALFTLFQNTCVPSLWESRDNWCSQGTNKGATGC